MFADKEHKPESKSSTPNWQNPFVQKKTENGNLEIGSQDDPQEKEADEVAEKVLTMRDESTATGLTMKEESYSKVHKMGSEEKPRTMTMKDESAAWRKYDKEHGHLKKKEEQDDKPPGKMGADDPQTLKMSDDQDGPLRRMGEDEPQTMKMGDDDEGSVRKMGEDQHGAETASPAFQQQLNASKGQGQSLPDEVQQDIGPKMGADLSDVKIHTDSPAHEMATDINAKAFTYGNDIYFKKGNYNPTTEQGKKLLVHESWHTVQQSKKVLSKLQRQPQPKKKTTIKNPDIGAPLPIGTPHHTAVNHEHESDSLVYQKKGIGDAIVSKNYNGIEDTYKYNDQDGVDFYGKAVIYERKIRVHLDDGRTMEIYIDGQTAGNTITEANKSGIYSKDLTSFEYYIKVFDGQGKEEEILSPGMYKSTKWKSGYSISDAIQDASSANKIPATLLKPGPIDDHFMAVAKVQADAMLQAAAKDDKKTDKPWDQLTKEEKKSKAWSEIWEKTSMGDVVLPLIVGVILGIAMLILSFFASVTVIIGVLVVALVALIAMFINEYANAKDDEEKSYIISRYTVYILAAIAGILVAIFAPEMLAMAAMIIGIVALVASIVIGLVYVMRRVERASNAESPEQFGKETDQGANIVENTIVDVALFIITSLLPKFGTRLAPKPGTSFREWINPWKRSTPPGTPPAGVKTGTQTSSTPVAVNSILTKGERLKIFFNKLNTAQPASNPDEAIVLINKTLDEVEDAYSGVAKNPNAVNQPNRDDGRMYGILDQKYVIKNPDGSLTAKTRGNIIEIKKSGAIKIYSLDRKTIFLDKSGK